MALSLRLTSPSATTIAFPPSNSDRTRVSLQHRNGANGVKAGLANFRSTSANPKRLLCKLGPSKSRISEVDKQRGFTAGVSSTSSLEVLHNTISPTDSFWLSVISQMALEESILPPIIKMINPDDNQLLFLPFLPGGKVWDALFSQESSSN